MKKRSSSKAKIVPRLLLDLSVLQAAMILSRPSALIRTPYVADVITHADAFSQLNMNDVASPSLSKKKLKDLVDNLRNKFEIIQAHAPSLDCAGMVVAGSKVFCSPGSSTSKSKLVIQLCEEIREDGTFTTVGYHPYLAEKISRQLLDLHLLDSELGFHYDCILSQQVI